MTDVTRVECRCGFRSPSRYSAPPIAQFFCHCDGCSGRPRRGLCAKSVYPAWAVEVVRGEPTS